MALNPKFVATQDIDAVFTDKDTGEVLAGGYIEFYSDPNFTVAKDVFILSGTSTTPIYTNIGPRVDINVAGSPSYNNNNIVIYYYPYDATGKFEYYYIKVFSAGGIQQFTRGPWPNLVEDTNVVNNDVQNYVPNGQFITFNSNPATSVETIDGLTTNVQYFAQGGWSFNQSTDGTAGAFTLSFSKNTGTVTGVNNFPKYSLNWACTSGSTSTFKDIQIQWKDVNTFSQIAPSSPNYYTLYFQAQSNDANTRTFEVRLISNFGTGGSPSAFSDTLVQTITVAPTSSFQKVLITMPDNNGTSRGTNNDDYVAIAIRASNNTTFNVSMTDFVLTPGNTTITVPPVQTESEMTAQSIAGWLPKPASDGSDLYLPVVVTNKGMDFDRSVIGQIEPAIYSTSYATSFPILPCDGSAHKTGSSTTSDNYSSLGVPYSRLLNVLINDSPVTNVPKYGTGSGYSTGYAFNAGGLNAVIRLVNNNSGAATAAADVNTTFTIARMNTATANINYSAYNNVADTVLAVGTFTTPLAGASAGTSGFTITTLDNYTGLLAQQYYAFTIQTIAATGLANPGGAGKYFQFSNATTTFYMWFHFTNETDPTPGGTGIRIDMDNCASSTAQDVANIVREAINQFQMSTITVTTLPTGGHYFEFSSTTTNYYVWYLVNGVGSDPALPGKTPIKVTLTGSETNAQIASKTQLAINSYQFATPDLRGMFLRGLDPSGTWDKDVLQRWSTVTQLSGANLGTFEFSQFLSHTHNLTNPVLNTGVGFNVGGAVNASFVTAVPNTGGTETRPVNAVVNYFIRY